MYFLLFFIYFFIIFFLLWLGNQDFPFYTLVWVIDLILETVTVFIFLFICSVYVILVPFMLGFAIWCFSHLNNIFNEYVGTLNDWIEVNEDEYKNRFFCLAFTFFFIILLFLLFFYFNYFTDINFFFIFTDSIIAWSAELVLYSFFSNFISILYWLC